MSTGQFQLPPHEGWYGIAAEYHSVRLHGPTGDVLVLTPWEARVWAAMLKLMADKAEKL